MTEIRLESWGDLQEAMFADSWRPELGRHRSNFAFRGRTSADEDLRSSLLRLGGDARTLEGYLLRNFRKYAHQGDVPSDSVDTVIATSSIEHMYTDEANGDECAVASIAHVLKPGGFAAITVPMSNGGPFHEAPKGDARFAGPYRLYTPETIRERFLSNPDLEVVRHAYLAQTTPDPRYDDLRFAGFWHSFTEEEKLRWSWAYPILSGVFNPIVEAELGRRRESSLNTALVLLRKRPD